MNFTPSETTPSLPLSLLPSAERMYTAQGIPDLKRTTSHPRVKTSLCIFYNSPGKRIDAGLPAARYSRFRRHGRGREESLLAVSSSLVVLPVHLRHSSQNDSNFNSITRTTRRLHLFLHSHQESVYRFFFPENPLRVTSADYPSVALSLLSQQNLNLIMTLHVAVLAPIPPSVAYLPVASVCIGREVARLFVPFPFPQKLKQGRAQSTLNLEGHLIPLSILDLSVRVSSRLHPSSL